MYSAHGIPPLSLDQVRTSAAAKADRVSCRPSTRGRYIGCNVIDQDPDSLARPVRVVPAASAPAKSSRTYCPASNGATCTYGCGSRRSSWGTVCDHGRHRGHRGRLDRLAALIVAILANRNASRSADASPDSAREAKRSADAAERQAAAEAALPPPPPAVAWKAELRGIARKGKGATFVLRNVGTSTAAGVQVVVPPAHDGLVRPELGSGEVPAHGSFQVVVLGIDQLPDLHELLIAWDGRDEPVQVPLPAW